MIYSLNLLPAQAQEKTAMESAVDYQMVHAFFAEASFYLLLILLVYCAYLLLRYINEIDLSL